jgi:hypothetical protein
VTRFLLLVDLDNLLGDSPRGVPVFFEGRRGFDLAPRPDDSDLAGLPTRSQDAAVVVTAFNTDTARAVRDFAALERFARRAAIIALGHHPGTIILEHAVTLIVPQSADVALHRLLERAASPAGAGSFGAVRLLSRDRGLRLAFDERLAEHRPGPCGSSGPLLHYWQLWSSLVRTLPAAVPSAPAEAPRHQWSASVATRAEVQWAAAETIDITPKTPAVAWSAVRGATIEGPPYTLKSVVDLIAGYGRNASFVPLLSQVGITRDSVLGIARFGELATGSLPTLGPFRSDDGLELNRAPDPGAPVTLLPETLVVSAASVGIGAVTVLNGEHRATLRTRLPAEVVRDACRIMGLPWAPLAPTKLGRVDDDALVQALPANTPIGVPADLRFEALHGGTLRVQVLAPFAQWPALWWYASTTTARRPKSERRIEGGAGLLRSGVAFSGRAAMARLDGELELVPVSTHPPGVTMSARTTLLPWTLGPAGIPGHTADAALLALGETIAEGEVVLCTRIQNVPNAPLMAPPDVRERWAELRRLPLLVRAETVGLSDPAPSLVSSTESHDHGTN